MAKRYAYNTSATQIKKRYAMIDSTATQVKKRYAMIGSTATLVYSAEEQIYPGATVKSLQVNAGSYSTANFKTNVTSSSSNQNSTTLYIAVDVTDYKTIKVTGNFTVSGGTFAHAGVFLLAPSKWNESYVKYPYYMIVDSYYTQRKVVDSDASFTTHSFNVSSLTGTYYIAIGCYVNSTGGSRTASAQITGITAEPA